MIKKEIEAKRTVKMTTKYFISLPCEEAHSGHPTGQAGVHAQKLQPAISQKIVELVDTEIMDTNEIRLFRTTPPTEQATCNAETYREHEETLLYIKQEDWQKELLTRYGNTVTLMDATYKTTKYSIPLFFVCVKTNVSYSVVAEFIIQSECAVCFEIMEPYMGASVLPHRLLRC